MKHVMRKYLTLLLCAALLLGVLCPAAAAGNATEPAATEEGAVPTGDPAKTIYATSEEATFVPAGYTYVYTGENGETYTQVAESDMYVSSRVLTAEEAKAIAELQCGESKTIVADDGSTLQQMAVNPQEAAQYSRALEAILSGSPVPEGEPVQVLCEAHPRDELVDVMVFFEDRPVAEMAGMSVSLGQPLGQAERNACQAVERAQVSAMAQISRTLGYEVQAETQLSLLSNAVSATVKYEDLGTIRQVPGVKRVILMPVYSVPEEEAVTVQSAEQLKPYMKSAGPAIGANQAWDLGYLGEGMSVAVIDTGISLINPAFQQEPLDQSRVAYTKRDVAGILAGYNLHAEEIVEDLTADQVYYSSKIPFAFNYADGAADYGECHGDAHGSHVAGIVAGKLPEEAKEQFDMDTMGIAPEAQLVVMKVFDARGLCAFSSLAAALEDAIALGVDCANLSLGADAGAYYDEGVTEFYEAACDAGINVVIAAGNAASTGKGSLWGNNMVKSSTVATGMVGAPGTYSPVLTVASAENDTVVSVSGKVLSYLRTLNIYRTELPYWEHPDVPEGKGLQETFGGRMLAYTDSLQDAAGKLVFLKLTEENVDALVAQAVRVQAAALILYQDPEHGQEKDVPVQFEQTDFSLPVASISYDNFNAFAKYPPSDGEIRVDQFWNPNQAAGEMSSFSSWGPTDGLTLKPEITGIGGNVFSAYYGDYFAVMSGTSMASPTVAASAALVRQYLKEAGVEAPDLSDTVNRLLMSTATPIVDEEHHTFYFVRRQGAGLVNLAAALASQAYIQVEGTNKSKFELGDDPERTGVYTMDFEVVNFSDEEKTYTLDTTVLGQKAEGGQLRGGKVTYLVYDYARELHPAVASTAADGRITVPAHSTAQVTVTVTLSDEDKSYMDERFPYGAYVEGFVQLISEDSVSLSAPFLAFYGDFGEAPLFDTETYASLLGGQYAYTTADHVHHTLSSIRYVDSWESLGSFKLPQEVKRVYLGTSRDYNMVPESTKVELGGLTSQYLTFQPKRAGISPNGDKDLDFLHLEFALNRNAKSVKYTVTNAVTGEVLWEQEMEGVSKTYNENMFLGSVFNNSELELDWLYPIVYDSQEDVYKYDTSRCLLENNTQVKIRVEAATELETGTPNANDAVEFYFYIDTQGPISEPSSVSASATEFSPDYTEYIYRFKPDETWFVDYGMACQIQRNPETDTWSGSVFRVIYDSGVAGDVWGTGAFAGRCTDDNKTIFMACDYAGNISIVEIQGGSHLMDEHVKLQAGTTTLAVGETVTLENIAENDFELNLNWSSLTPEVGEVTQCGGSSCAVTARACGFLKVRCSFGSNEKFFTFRVIDPSQEETFTDISSHWAKDDIVMAASLGLFRGMTTTTFCPELPLTRGQLVTVLHRMEGSPEAAGDSGFQDVTSEDFYTEAVTWAKESGIVCGVTETLFRPADPVTREQFAAILYRYASWKGQDVTAQGDLTPFADAAKISTYAQVPMAWAVAEGLIQGISEDTLCPQGRTTRAQAAAILIRYLEQL